MGFNSGFKGLNLYPSIPYALFSLTYCSLIIVSTNLTPLRPSCNCCYPAFIMFWSLHHQERWIEVCTVYKCEIWGFQSSDCDLTGCGLVETSYICTNVLPHSSR